MVNMAHSKTPKLNITIEEQFLYAKSGRLDECEDFIFTNDNFIAVVDGSTSKIKRKWNGDTLGRIAGKLVIRSLSSTPPGATAREAVDIMTETLGEFYHAEKLFDQLRDNPSLKATASLVVLSLARKEVWLVGDCQALLNDQLIKGDKKIDSLLSEIRSVYLETELLVGKKIEQLLENDTGREYIMPILKRQQLYQNNPSHTYWYPAIDGFPVPDEGIIVEPVAENISSIVLASDGYISLHKTLDDSEKALKKILEQDPLLFRLYKSTKGKLAGLDSFDDRAYIRVSIG